MFSKDMKKQSNNKYLDIIRNLTIQVKLFVFAGWLLLALVITNVFGGVTTNNLHSTMQEMGSTIGEIESNAEMIQNVLDHQQSSLDRLDIAQNLLRTFGEFKYWLTDLSASWLNESEYNADAAKEQLAKQIEKVSKFAPEEAKSMLVNIDKIYDLAIEAVDAYVDSNRVKGNSLLAEARREITKVDNTLSEIVNEQKALSGAAKAKALDSTKTTIHHANTVLINVDKSIKHAESSMYQITIFIIAIIIVSITLTWFSIKSLIVPIQRIVVSMHKLATGSADIEIPPVTRNEIGALVESLHIFKQNKIYADNLSSEQKILDEDKHKRAEYVAVLIKNFQAKTSQAMETFASAATELHQTASSLDDITLHVNEKTELASNAAENTSSNVGSVASATKDLSEAVKEMSQHLSSTATLVQKAVHQTENAGVSAKSLDEEALKMGDVVSLIRDIAGQINLLALNATIESARAGEAGKGFAVVASEVKNLATQTTEATEEISTQIESMQSISSEVVGVLAGIKESIDQVNEYSGNVAAAVEEQSATTDDILRNMQDASSNTEQVSHSLVDIKELSGNSSASSNELLGASQMLSKEAEQLNQDINKFLSDVQSEE